MKPSSPVMSLNDVSQCVEPAWTAFFQGLGFHDVSREETAIKRVLHSDLRNGIQKCDLWDVAEAGGGERERESALLRNRLIVCPRR